MTITRNFKLCLNAGTQNAPYINVNQYDEGEQWIFDLYTEGGQKFTPSTGAIIGIKSDGNAILNSGTVNSDGQVVITETQQMTAASGLAVFELLIEGETHGTANFIVNVERRPSDDAEFSDSDLSMLQEAIDAAEVINEILDEGGDPSEIITENVNAWLDNHPEATTTVQDGAITAPKINNSLWDKLLVSEEASGNPASFDDGADDVPVSSLKVALEPVQLGSGDPSPSNIRPIVASNGKNLLPPSTTQTSNGVKFTVNADGTITATRIASSTNNAEYDLTVPSSLYGKTVILNGCPSGGSDGGTYRMFFLVNGSRQATDYGNGVTYTIPSSSTSCVVRINVFKDFNSTATFRPMIRLASIADSTYQPYQGIMVDVVGKNLLPMTLSALKASNTRGTWNGNTYTDTTTVSFRVDTDSNGNVTQIVANGTGTAAGVFYIRAYDLPNGSYIFSGCPSGAAWNTKYRIRIGDKTDAYINDLLSEEKTITVTNGITMQINTGSGYACNNLVFKPMIRNTDTDSTFEPYTSASYPYTLGQSVYGGTVDLATGVLTVDRGYVDLGGNDWNNADASGWVQQVLTIDDAVFVPNSQVADIYCDVFVKASANDVYNKVHNNSICINSQKKLQIYCTAIASMSGANIKTYLTGHYLIYPLATPITIQLTPTQVKTLLGYNNISSTGTVDVIYHADTKLYIDKKIGELS